jgi:hypothetical protein
VMMPFEQFDQPRYASILMYLQRRFLIIETFEAGNEGYTIRWVAEALRLNRDKRHRADKVRHARPWLRARR